MVTQKKEEVKGMACAIAWFVLLTIFYFIIF